VAARILVLTLCLFVTPPAAHAQDLVPGAYTPGPVGFNVVTLVAGLNIGDVAFDPSLPVEDGRANIRGAAIGVGRSLSLAGRYANVGLVVPYVHGRVEGRLLGEFQQVTRSGPGDVTARIAVNLYGARAMSRKEFAAYRPSTVAGLSFVVGIPVGQYFPDKVINIGTNRWSFKPELGVSRTRGRWTFEGDLGAVFFTDNTNFRDGGLREQAPIVTVQAHIIRTIRPGFWAAFDCNFWHGGRVTTNGVKATELQHNSRFGGTLAVPIRRQQVRISVSSGAYTRLGGDFTSIGVSYSYAWTTRQ
jgi:hypothetical protein